MTHSCMYSRPPTCPTGRSAGTAGRALACKRHQYWPSDDVYGRAAPPDRDRGGGRRRRWRAPVVSPLPRLPTLGPQVPWPFAAAGQAPPQKLHALMPLCLTHTFLKNRRWVAGSRDNPVILVKVQWLGGEAACGLGAPMSEGRGRARRSGRA